MILRSFVFCELVHILFRGDTVVKRTLSISLLLFTSFVCLQANAAFMNGSFEDFGMETPPAAGTFDIYTNLPGWTGFDNIEIHPDGFIANAQDGEFYAELNAHPEQRGAFAIEQEFDTDVGQQYLVTFYAQAREMGGDGAPGFTVFAGGDSAIINTHIFGAWMLFDIAFTATDMSSILRFESNDAGDDTVGHFLDNIYVKPVPLPGALVMLAGGLLGLGAFRRREIK